MNDKKSQEVANVDCSTLINASGASLMELLLLPGQAGEGGVNLNLDADLIPEHDNQKLFDATNVYVYYCHDGFPVFNV